MHSVPSEMIYKIMSISQVFTSTYVGKSTHQSRPSSRWAWRVSLEFPNELVH